MRDLIYVGATVAFFALGWLYIAACARILATSGDFDQPVEDEAAEDEAGDNQGAAA